MVETSPPHATSPGGSSAPAEESGVARFFRHLRTRRDRFRQFVQAIFCALLTFLGHPTTTELTIGGAILIVGIAIRMWASGYVKKDKELATDGPYGFVRHPLYTGNTVLAIGLTVASGLWWGIPLWIVIHVLFFLPAIESEDNKLHKLFGETWERWAENTPAIIPRPGHRAKSDAEPGSWSFRQSLVQNGEPIYAVVLILCLVILHAGRIG